ncbi:unnamed protein product [Choristocarpus tenellus]
MDVSVDDLKIGANGSSYLHSKEWPFTEAQFDVDKEDKMEDALLQPGGDVPLLSDANFREINVHEKGIFRRELQDWDEKCAKKHITAICDSVISPEEAMEYILQENEGILDTLDLVGIENAPGVHSSISQCCRLTLTSLGRIIFTQGVHTADVVLQEVGLLERIFSCHAGYGSSRKWVSYCGTISSQEVLQVFVQQDLATTYNKSPWSCFKMCE